MALLRIYGECARRALRDVARSPWVLLLPLGYAALLVVAGLLLSPLPEIVASFALGFLQAALAASFLYVLDELSTGSRVRVGEMATSAGRFLWPVVNVLFVFWLANLARRPILDALPNGAVIELVLTIALLVVLNATPETIHVERRLGGLDTIVASARFLQAHWIEWLLPNGLFLAAALFGLPWATARLPLGRLGPIGSLIAIGAIEGALLVPVMLFRAHLYRRLASGPRASAGDAWREAWRR